MRKAQILHEHAEARAAKRQEENGAHELGRPRDGRDRGLSGKRCDGIHDAYGEKHPERDDVHIELAPVLRRRRDLESEKHCADKR